MPKKGIDKQPIQLKSWKTFEKLEDFCNIITKRDLRFAAALRYRGQSATPD